MKWIDVLLEKVFNIKHEDPIVDFFGGQEDLMKESEYLVKKRLELVSNNSQNLLINNPNLQINLRRSQVLKKGKY